uniref:Uncharacterized protein n=1 Tax=Meloidogyne enterolobii TaxID=390850 RepID=A0A6V7VY52_MELEN|nr:unnamed protein product [Meloidogyne enterolobii]
MSSGTTAPLRYGRREPSCSEDLLIIGPICCDHTKKYGRKTELKGRNRYKIKNGTWEAEVEAKNLVSG